VNGPLTRSKSCNTKPSTGKLERLASSPAVRS
jgi:hypothetical protein